MKDIIKEVNNIPNMENINKKQNENILLTFLVLLKRFSTFPFSLLNSFLLSSEDICNIPENSKEWENMKKIIFRVNSKNDNRIEELQNNGNKNQTYMLSVIYDSFIQKGAMKKVFTAVGEGIHLKLDKEAREIHFKKARLHFDPELVLELEKMRKNKFSWRLKHVLW